MKVLFAIVALLVCAALGSAAVVDVTSATFDSVVMDASKNVLVSFTAPWCGHCVRMKPAYAALGAEALDEDIVIANVDVTANEDIADKVGIEGFPTIKYFTKGDKKGKEYHGPRDTAALKKFVVEKKE